MDKEKFHDNSLEELPHPVERRKVDSGMHEQEISKSVELGSTASATTAHVIPQVNQQPKSGQSRQAAPQASLPHSGSMPIITPHIADDQDLIEREWVESAKRIVAQTKHDPHAQSEGLSAVKEDYKKKRFHIDNNLGKAA